MVNSEVTPEKLAQLLHRIGSSDGSVDDIALRHLHACCMRRLLPFAQRIVKSRALAEEVLQESFIAIWRDAAKFDASRAAPLTWMITIVRNKAIDCMRSNALRERMTAHDQHDAPRAFFDPAAGPCEIVERGQRRRQIDDGLTRLGMRPRLAIELAFFEELTHDEVATRMTIPLGTVKTWIRRGCQQIRREMERPMSRSCDAGQGTV